MMKIRVSGHQEFDLNDRIVTLKIIPTHWSGKDKFISVRETISEAEENYPIGRVFDLVESQEEEEA